MAQIKTYVIVAQLLLGVVFAGAPALAEKPVFRFYISQSPASFDPAQFNGSEVNHLFANIYRGLYKYSDVDGVVPEGAEKCVWKSPKTLKCHLKEKLKWTDGSFIVARDYVRAFQYLIDPQNKARELSHLLKLKNAKLILAGKKEPEKLGVRALSKWDILFDFDEADPEFLAKLTSPLLVPWKQKPDIKNADHLISNGPYKIKSLDATKAVLVPNLNYPSGEPNRPDVEIYFIDEDVTAQNLFETGKLDLQSRLNVSFIPKYKDTKGFFQKTFSRFDYVGFGPDILKNEDFRKALTMAVDYDELKTILFAVGRPGCPGLTANYINRLDRCYPFDLKEAKSLLEKVPDEIKNKKLVMKFSKAGGDSILKIMEWYQNQWKKNLGLDIELVSVEAGMYLQDLKNNPPDFYRKGLNLDRPTCAAALESFTTGHRDNFINFRNKNFDLLVHRVASTKNKDDQKKICDHAIRILMSDYRMIPQGLIHFSMLDDGKFEGYQINELNQIDLSGLNAKVEVKK